MPIPSVLADLSDPNVELLVPHWLALVAERLPDCTRGRQVHLYDKTLNLTWPGDLLLAVVYDAQSRWHVRAMTLREVSVGGVVHPRFSPLGRLECDVAPGCGSVARMVGLLAALSEPEVLADALLGAPDAPVALIEACVRPSQRG